VNIVVVCSEQDQLLVRHSEDDLWMCREIRDVLLARLASIQEVLVVGGLGGHESGSRRPCPGRPPGLLSWSAEGFHLFCQSYIGLKEGQPFVMLKSRTGRLTRDQDAFQEEMNEKVRRVRIR
jgi:hypothetical protein